MAALTASCSTALLVLGLQMLVPSALAPLRGTIDPADLTWQSVVGVLLGSALLLGIPTAVAVMLSLVVTVPMGVVWAWLTRRLIGRSG